MKHRIVHTLQKYVLNPPIKLALSVGVPLPGYALLETRGIALACRFSRWVQVGGTEFTLLLLASYLGRTHPLPKSLLPAGQ
jgi:hypothetical protein